MTEKDSGTNGDKEGARTHLVDALVNTPEERLSELTILKGREVFVFSMSEMWDSLLDKDYKPGSLAKTFRIAAYRHKRSQGGNQLIRIGVLAEAQLGEEQEDEIEGEDID